MLNSPQILRLLVETLGIFHIRLYMRVFASNPALFSKIIVNTIRFGNSLHEHANWIPSCGIDVSMKQEMIQREHKTTTVILLWLSVYTIEPSHVE